MSSPDDFGLVGAIPGYTSFLHRPQLASQDSALGLPVTWG